MSNVHQMNGSCLNHKALPQATHLAQALTLPQAVCWRQVFSLKGPLSWPWPFSFFIGTKHD